MNTDRLTTAIQTHKQGQLSTAANLYRQILEDEPHQPDALHLLGVIEAQQGNLEVALSLFIKAIRYHHKPSAMMQFNLAQLFKAQGKIHEAILHYQQAIQLDAQKSHFWDTLGEVYAEAGHIPQALNCYQRALTLAPDHPGPHERLGNILCIQGQTEEARQHYQQAFHLKPSSRLQILLATLLPPIYISQAALLHERKQMEQQVSALLNTPLKQEPMSAGGILPHFFLPYQGLNDRNLLQNIGKLYRPFFSSSQPTRKKHGKIRLGFISRHMYEHSVGICFYRMFSHFSRDQFDIYIYAAVPLDHQDQITQYFRETADVFIQLPRNLQSAKEVIQGHELDVLFFLDLGMEPFTYFLAFHRLAPTQYLLSGHPVTSGLDTIDAFISSRLFETPASPDHYTEKLICLDGLPYDYPRPHIPLQLKTREQLGLPQGKRLYVCPMTLVKIHPEFDLAIQQILEQDPEGLVLFFRYKQSSLHQQLQTRFQKAIPSVSERIHFLPWMSYPDYLSVLNQADILLDTFHFSGLTTAFQAMAIGAPMITCPSPYLRGRLCFGLYQRMGIFECVADHQEMYVKLALRLAADRAQHHHLKEKILTHHHVLYENPEGVQEMIKYVYNKENPKAGD